MMSVKSALKLPRATVLVDSMKAVFSQSDYISLNIPYINKPSSEGGTHGIIGRDLLMSVPAGCKILNFARGELVDSEAMKSFLDANPTNVYVTDFPDDLLYNHEQVRPGRGMRGRGDAKETCFPLTKIFSETQICSETGVDPDLVTVDLEYKTTPPHNTRRALRTLRLLFSISLPPPWLTPRLCSASSFPTSARAPRRPRIPPRPWPRRRSCDSSSLARL